MELTNTDILYIAFACMGMLNKDLNNEDRDAYENLLYKCRISRKAEKIREALGLKGVNT